MSERGLRFEFVSADKAEFREEQKKEQAGKNPYFSLGGQELNAVRRLEEMNARTQEQIDSGEMNEVEGRPVLAFRKKSIERGLRRVFEGLRERLTSNRRAVNEVKSSFIAFLQSANVMELLNGEEIRDVKDFFQLFDEDKVSSDQLKRLLEVREQYQENLQKEWEPRFEAFRDNYRQCLHQAIKDGIIPAHDVFDARLDDAQIEVQDILSVNIYGSQRGFSAISVRVEQRHPQQVRHILFHELTHRISGTVIQETNGVEDAGESVPSKKATLGRKIGLAFPTHDGVRGGWLNEGVTELLARRLAGLSEVTTYEVEQNVITELIELGVPERLFIEAYFEDRAEKSERGSYLPAFLMLHNKMCEVYRADWLKDLQSYVDEQYEDG